MLTLNTLPMKSIGIITDITGDKKLITRLIECGFSKQSEIIPVFTSLSDDMTAYLIKGSIIALRSEESRCVKIKLKNR